jgi:hypothetical protein
MTGTPAWGFQLSQEIPMKKLAILSLTVALACVAGVRADPPGWGRAAPSGSGFSVLMPGSPVANSNTQRNPVFGSVVYKALVANTDAAVYQVIYCDLPAWAVKAEGMSPRQFLNAFSDGFTKGGGAVELSRQEIALAGNPGLSCLLHMADKGIYGQARVYLVGNRVYVVMAMSIDRQAVVSPEATQFFNSFQLSGRTGLGRMPAIDRAR